VLTGSATFRNLNTPEVFRYHNFGSGASDRGTVLRARADGRVA